MPRFLVSGIPAFVADVAAALEQNGADAVQVGDIADVPQACADAGPAAFDGYIQLPASFTVQGETAIQRVHHFFADGVLARFAAVEAALTAMRPDARITFVLGVLPAEVSTQDDVDARAALVRVLGHAARADAGPGLRLDVLASDSTPKEIALTALGRGGERPPVGEMSDESYAEWRMELLGIVWAQT
jgi:hypothetical protein